MSKFKKLAVYLIMFIPAILIAGIYGALHDQISYTVSQEYFTHFKFIQFSIPWAQESPRLGAAVVGMRATWWMGVVVFMILGLFGFMFSTPKKMALELFKATILAVVVALLTAMVGLLYGYVHVDEANIATYHRWIWEGVTDPIQFVRVGLMHNASYIGGLTGLLSAIVYLIFKKWRLHQAIS